MKNLLLMQLVFCMSVIATQASAQYSAPCDSGGCKNGLGFDHAGKDYSCGSRRYAGHQGQDLLSVHGNQAWDTDVPIYAQVTGVVIKEYHDCKNWQNTANYPSNPTSTKCGEYFGNWFKLRDRFGNISILGHFKYGAVGIYDSNGDFIKNFEIGDVVHCGQLVGYMGSSGDSSAMHTHLETREANGARFDQYAGQCSETVSWWMDQRGYSELPGMQCYDAECVASPGQRSPLDWNTKITESAIDSVFGTDVERMAFLKAYGYTKYLEEAAVSLPAGQTRVSLGCAQYGAGGTPSFVHGAPSDSKLLLQDFYQSDTSLRFPGSEGDAVITLRQGKSVAYIMHSGFWGVYKCLRQVAGDAGSERMGGVKWLGAPTSDEHVPGSKAGDPFTASSQHGYAAVQTFERGYMSYFAKDGKIRVHVNGATDADMQEIAQSARDCGANIIVEKNPPMTPDYCNGGDTQVCYHADQATIGVGNCQAGVQVCIAQIGYGSEWGECVMEILPAAEECYDGMDNDCDDNVDCEDPDCASQIGCASNTGGSGGAGGAGGSSNTGGSGGQGCECVSGEFTSCYTACNSPGVKACDANTCLWKACQPAYAEICGNGVDEDCNQLVDCADSYCTNDPSCANQNTGGASGAGGSSGAGGAGGSAGIGGTLNTGGTSGTGGGSNDVCSLGATTSCYDGPSGTMGLGQCHSGTRSCVSGSNGNIWSTTCSGQVLPQAEVCNNLDDDCDGAIDDGNPGGQQACQVAGAKGPCATGSSFCSNGIMTCLQTVFAKTEICGNNLDDDCDGQADDGCLPKICAPYATESCACTSGNGTRSCNADGTVWSVCGNCQSLLSIKLRYEGASYWNPVLKVGYTNGGYDTPPGCTSLGTGKLECEFTISPIQLPLMFWQVELGMNKYWGDASGVTPAPCIPEQSLPLKGTSIELVGTVYLYVDGQPYQFQTCGNGYMAGSQKWCGTGNTSWFPYVNGCIQQI